MSTSMGRLRAIIVVVILAITAGAALRLKPVSPSEGKTEVFARLAVTSDRLEFGTVWEDEQFAWTLPIENQEPVPVEIESFSKSCSCASVEPQSFTLAPGERRELRLKIDLSQNPNPTGEVNVRMSAVLRPGALAGKRRGPEWKVQGQVRRALNFERNVSLGRHSELAQPLPPWTATVKSVEQLESLTARSELPGITASVLPPVAGGDVYSVMLTPSRPLPVGMIEGDVVLVPRLSNGELLPSRRVHLQGRIVPDVEVEPTAILVGGRKVGEIIEVVVTLRSLTGREVKVEEATAEGEGLSFESLAGGGYHVRQHVCREGSQSNRMYFITRVSGQRCSVVLPVDYTGLQP